MTIEPGPRAARPSSGSGPYVLRHGDVWRVSGPGLAGRHAPETHVARGSERVALCFDAATGMLRKHGEAEAVRAWATAERGRLDAAGCQEMAQELSVVDFPPTDSTLSALNACIALGSAEGFLGRLVALGAAEPDLAAIPTYPR